MGELVLHTENQVPAVNQYSCQSGDAQYIDSREVARMVGKKHCDLLRDIRRYVERFNLTNAKIASNDFFIERTYKDGIGRTHPCYFVTQKGCDFLANKFIGEKSTKFRAAYLEKMSKNPIKSREMHEKHEQTITTLEIAEMMDVDHKLILRKLEGRESNGKHVKGYVEILNENQMVPVDYFIKSTYKDTKGETRPCYNVTRLGCDFLANKFTGEKGVLFTAKYVKRFREMEEALSGGGVVAGTHMKMLEYMEHRNEIDKQQAEFNLILLERLERLEESKEKRICNTGSINPFISLKPSESDERLKNLNTLASKVAGLYGRSKNEILHCLYKAMEDDLQIPLTAYQVVYTAEHGDSDVSTIRVISENETLYKKAMELCENTIRRKQIF